VPISKQEVLITSVEDWRRLAPPKSPSHWVDGRSAKEMALAWLEGGGRKMPAEVQTLLESHKDFGAVLQWDAEPEAKLRFDSHTGEPRNSDLVARVRDRHGTYVLAVEGKADESFGETLEAAFLDSLERRLMNPRSKGLDRLQALATGLLRQRQKGQPPATALRYQLLTATAGALAEAKRLDCDRAIMLVHEFITDATRDQKHDRNAHDLNAFVARLDAAGGAPIGSQLLGPFDTVLFPGVRLYVGKAIRRRRRGA
jgi:hypothetical protein